MDGPDRQILYCLKCKKPYENLSTHMRKVCMKKDTEEMRKERLRQAKISQKDWTKVARSWEYGEIAELMNSADPCRALIERLESKGFFVLNNPGRSTADVVTNEKEVVNNVPGSPGEQQNHVLDRRCWIPADLLYPISVSKENHLVKVRKQSRARRRHCTILPGMFYPHTCR
ncbi:hypothetical protein AALO_G00297600 [Alosa alosa]|uniref:C2H2-type domain-containing protein n=1 Tax=Alosa alosa TaxID=278164 RepID=A0AAV6FGV7_9TELE|nr:hypothetical protein AALO_G00297600 [Alosa alosa]